MTLADARRCALALPGVTEEPHFDWGSWRVRGKPFTTIPTGGELLHIFLEPEDVDVLTSNLPGSFEELWWGKKLLGVRVKLEGVDEELICSLLEKAWRRRAPKTLIAQLDREAAGETEGAG